ncbi:MAG: oligosaccharide flippase family protein [Pyrinomonadaceae bacterium]
MTPDLNTPPVVSDASKRRDSSWDIRNAPRNYISLVLFQVGSALFSFGAVWLITRHLGSEGYGGIIAIIAASQVAQVLVNWTSVAVVRFGVDEFIETEKIARTFWLRFLVLAANLILVAAVSSFWFPPLADWLKLTPESFWLVMTHFAVTSLWIHVQMSLQGAKLPRVQGFLMMIERLLIFAGLFALTASAWLTPSWAMICYIAAPAAALIWGIFELRRYIWSRFSVDRVFVQKFVAYSLPLLPFSLVGYFSGSYVDAIFLSKFLSTSDLGVYSVATQINGIALQLPTLANSLLLPLFVTLQRETENQRSFNYFRNVLPTLTLLWSLACTALAFVAYFAIPMVFGAEFQGASSVLWVLLAGSAIALPALLGYFPFTNAVSATYISMIGGVLAAIANVIANFLLIPKFGLIGCAYATALSYLVNVLTSALLLRVTSGLPISWNLVALLPAAACGSWFFFTENIWISIAIFVFSVLFLAVLKSVSIRRGIGFVYTMIKGDEQTATL